MAQTWEVWLSSFESLNWASQGMRDVSPIRKVIESVGAESNCHAEIRTFPYEQVWREAIKEELDSFISSDTSVSKLPGGRKATTGDGHFSGI